MMLKQRRNRWADGSDAANDCTVIDGEKIGRIYRTLVGRGRGYAWNWMVYRGPVGHAPTLEAAQAAFKAAWATCQPRERGA